MLLSSSLLSGYCTGFILYSVSIMGHILCPEPNLQLRRFALVGYMKYISGKVVFKVVNK